MSGTALLSATDVSVFYGRVEAVHDVSLSVEAGQIVTVIGANGAGKTTLLSALMGLLPARGHVCYLGQRLDDEPPEARVALGLGLVAERRELFGDMSVADNLLLGAFHRRRDLQVAQDLEDVYARFPKLKDRRAQLAATLSGGERQMLALATALLCRPRVLLVDELSLGLAPLVVETLMALVARLRDELGLAVLLVEQNAGAALAVANSGYVMEHGRIVYDGTVERLLAHEDVREFYLGVGHRAGRKSYSDVKQYQRRRRWF
jgi:branched-chain amino acid transport system ATP-binding protein